MQLQPARALPSLLGLLCLMASSACVAFSQLMLVTATKLIAKAVQHHAVTDYTAGQTHGMTMNNRMFITPLSYLQCQTLRSNSQQMRGHGTL